MATSSFEGKVVAITGGASGISLAAAQHLASLGAHIALSDVREDALHEAAKTIETTKGSVSTHVVDVRSSKQVNEWIQGVFEKHGRLDGALNGAGVGKRPGDNIVTKLVDIKDEEWEFVMGVNLTGVFNCVRAQIKVMKSGASIVNIASTAGIRGSPALFTYGASKAGVIHLTRSAAKESAASNIRVNALAPGPIDTPLLRSLEDELGTGPLQTPMGRRGKPEEVAKLIAFLLSDDSAFITGGVHVIDGASTA